MLNIWNNFALTSGDVGEAYSRCASVMKNSNISMEDSIGLIIGAQESIQDAPKVGNALKTIISNLAGVSINAKTGRVELNKYGKVLSSIGVNVLKKDGSLQDQMTTLEQVAKKWSTLSDAQKQAVTTTLAGKTQANVFSALMNNWQNVLQLQSDYNNGLTLGSAEEEKIIFSVCTEMCIGHNFNCR